MKKLVLTLASLMIFGAINLSAQNKTVSKRIKAPTQMKSKKAVHKKTTKGNYQMNKKSVKQSQGMMQPLEDPSKIKSTGKPVY